MPDEEASDAGGQAKQPLEVVVSSEALQVAKGWVQNMSGGADSDSEGDEVATKEFEARPPRLGLGAKYLPHSLLAGTLNPVEKKLRALTSAGKQREGDRENQRLPASRDPIKEAISKVQSDSEDEEEVKGSSLAPYGRLQRRSNASDLLMNASGSKGRGSKRKR